MNTKQKLKLEKRLNKVLKELSEAIPRESILYQEVYSLISQADSKIQNYEK